MNSVEKKEQTRNQKPCDQLDSSEGAEPYDQGTNQTQEGENRREQKQRQEVNQTLIVAGPTRFPKGPPRALNLVSSRSS